MSGLSVHLMSLLRLFDQQDAVGFAGCAQVKRANANFRFSEQRLRGFIYLVVGNGNHRDVVVRGCGTVLPAKDMKMEDLVVAGLNTEDLDAVEP